MALAQNIGALSWRLRAASDLAKLWHAQPRACDAHAILLPVYRQFSEGFETRDLQVAADLLALPAHLGDDAAANNLDL
jgi:predicted ATPase